MEWIIGFIALYAIYHLVVGVLIERQRRRNEEAYRRGRQQGQRIKKSPKDQEKT